MDEKICRECEYFTLRMGFHEGLYHRCCAYTRGDSTRLHELKECPRKWEPPEYIKRKSSGNPAAGQQKPEPEKQGFEAMGQDVSDDPGFQFDEEVPF